MILTSSDKQIFRYLVIIYYIDVMSIVYNIIYKLRDLFMCYINIFISYYVSILIFWTVVFYYVKFQCILLIVI